MIRHIRGGMRRALGAALLITSAAVISCNNPSSSDPLLDKAPGNSITDGQYPHPKGGQVGFEVQYFRGFYLSGAYDGDYDYKDFPVVSVISSKTEFERDFGKFNNSYFANAVEKYTDGFFTNKFLVIVSHWETSGSHSLDVEKIDDDGNIIISRLIPEAGDCAMAAWTVIIELDNSSKLEKYNAVFNKIFFNDADSVQYIRGISMETNGTVVISSKTELEQYYDTYFRDHLDIYFREYPFEDTTTYRPFAKYTDDFFVKNFLVIVSLTGPQNSTAYKVETIWAPGDIHITRFDWPVTAAEVGWTIIIERNNHFKAEKYNVILNKVPAPNLDIQYIRTGSVGGYAESPVVISSTAELKRYDLSIPYSIIGSDGVTSNGFTDKAAQYTDDFFKTNFLVIVPKGEPSGSIRHKVESVDEFGNIVISRLLPQVGTADVAAWHIIIPLNNDYKRKEYNAVFTDKLM